MANLLIEGGIEMGKVNTLLSERLKKGDQSSKMAAMAKQSASGNLTSFSGIFSVTELSEKERAFLENILREYLLTPENLTVDLQNLISITSEVKAINNQAAILHGERIKKAHTILTRYRDGAFTTWLMLAYGNRQTPYNFMQYYEFCEAIPRSLRPQIELMPRQAVYTLASREGPIEIKQKIVENYNGETKPELLEIIRKAFPLGLQDKRRQDFAQIAIQDFKKLCAFVKKKQPFFTPAQKEGLSDLLDQLRNLLLN